MSQNRIVIFSNGIADVRRSYPVAKGRSTEVSIPVRRDHVADVLASLNVYGKVTLTSPPSFRPSNELEGNVSIDSGKVFEDLATTFSGAQVTVDRAGDPLVGRLVGLHHEPEGTGGERIFPKHLAVLTEQGLRKCPLREVKSLQFADEAVQIEIDKALRRNFERIKPNSTFVDLAVDTDEQTAEAVVQYTIPAAAWKVSYRLREDQDGAFELQGTAIVDNNTDEDWNDCLISVVTGEPITFSTDLADSKTPRRGHVNVVAESALGAVEVEEAMPEMAAAMPMAEAAGAAEAMPKRALMRRARKIAGDELAELDDAVVETAEASEVGDFCVYSCQRPVSIAAKRSAAIPVIGADLPGTGRVLHYRRDDHPERPYSAVHFTNATGVPLARGVCTVYREGMYVGSCIVPAMKPDESRLLPHALETGVLVRCEPAQRVHTAVGVRLSDGFAVTSHHEQQVTTYTVRSSGDERFELFVDHVEHLHRPKVECAVTRQGGETTACDTGDRLPSGFRISLTLEPREQLALRVSESRVVESRVGLLDRLWAGWLQDNIVRTGGPLANHPGVQACLEIQRRLDSKRQEIRDAVEATERLAQRQERLRKNLQASGKDEQSARWRSDLGESEDRLTELEEQAIPRLREEEDAIEAELRSALESLSAEWTAG